MHSRPCAVVLYLKLQGYSLVGNIVLSLQVVRRAESWSPFEATPFQTTSSPVEHSHPDGLATIRSDQDNKEILCTTVRSHSNNKNN